MESFPVSTWGVPPTMYKDLIFMIEEFEDAPQNFFEHAGLRT